MGNGRTEQQNRIVALAAEEYGKGKGADHSTTGALILYIQELEALLNEASYAYQAATQRRPEEM